MPGWLGWWWWSYSHNRQPSNQATKQPTKRRRRRPRGEVVTQATAWSLPTSDRSLTVSGALPALCHELYTFLEIGHLLM